VKNKAKKPYYTSKEQAIYNRGWKNREELIKNELDFRKMTIKDMQKIFDKRMAENEKRWKEVKERIKNDTPKYHMKNFFPEVEFMRVDKVLEIIDKVESNAELKKAGIDYMTERLRKERGKDVEEDIQ
jgi:hypothetical protein